MLRRIFTMVAVSMAALAAFAPGAGAAEFGVQPGSLYAQLSGPGATQAGAAADLEFGFKMNLIDPALPQDPAGSIKNLEIDLPEGMIANPTPFPTCPVPLVNKQVAFCPADAAVGTVAVSPVEPGSGKTNPPELYKSRLFRVPAHGDEAAAFAFNALNVVAVRMAATADPAGGYRIRTTAYHVSEVNPVVEIKTTLWGIPTEHQGPGASLFFPPPKGPAPWPGMEGQLGTEGIFYEFGLPLPAEVSRRRFVSVPTRCTGSPLRLDVSLEPWQSQYATYHEGIGMPLPEGCEELSFDPSIKVTPESRRAGAPSGYRVELEVPQNEDPVGGLQTPNLKDATVALPAGVTISPSQANGLGACTDAQIELHGNGAPQCPDSSKIGQVSIDSPLLEEPVPGNIFLGSQESNDPESGQMYRIFVAAKSPGVRLKLEGQISVNRQTGQLTTTFAENPRLPFTKFTLSFKGGNGAPLVNPSTCGSYTTTSKLTPWGGPTATPQSTFTIDEGCGQAGFTPGLEAGKADPTAGAYSPFTLRVTRPAGQQNLGSIEAKLPPGLLAKLAGVPLCPDAQAGTGACPPASQVGRVVVGAGPGSNPIYVPQPGKAPTAVYLAGPYKGAPYSIVAKVPAQAGPFDLGTVTVRNALEVDPSTAQVTAKSDPLPQMLAGVPITYRDVRVVVDRPGFTVNPTSCAPMEVDSLLRSSAGATASPASRFQVGNCGALGFQPGLKLQLKGATGRTGHPALKAVVTAAAGEANIGRAQVGLPHAAFLDQGNLNKVCTQGDLKAGTCPASSIYGHAKAWTPLLDKPLEGPVYLGVGFGYKLPALVADLNGQIRILLVGRIDTTRQKGIRSTFETVPDAPVSRFVLEMKGGKKYGLLENSEDLCRKPQKANATFTGQNGKVARLRPKIAAGCKAKARRAQGSHRHRPQGPRG